jgi:hypothetical protein
MYLSPQEKRLQEPPRLGSNPRPSSFAFVIEEANSESNGKTKDPEKISQSCVWIWDQTCKKADLYALVRYSTANDEMRENKEPMCAKSNEIVIKKVYTSTQGSN